MRMIAENGQVVFAPWWSPGNADKAQLIAGGMDSEEFKSFPSGHVANAATLLLLVLLPKLRASLQSYGGILFWTAALWTSFVALTRIMMGAHFLTDTVVGWAITVGLGVLGLPRPQRRVGRPRSTKRRSTRRTTLRPLN